MRARGFSLVETALVLVVILMMTAWLATTYFQSEKGRREEQTAQQMEQIKERVANYAATNKTAVRYVHAINNRNGVTVEVRWTLPGGRPYLPCPDITGDGLEDRIPPPPPNSVFTLSITADTPDNYPLEERGGCFSSRGVLPWRTLGAPPSDPWGNRYTYRVAGVFSNAVSGFDQHARANSAYKTRPITVSADGGPLGEPFGLTTWAAVADDVFTDARGYPLVELRAYFSPAVICASAPCPAADSDLVAGAAAGLLATVSVNPNFADFDGALTTVFDPDDYHLLSGVPFVVVSHGRNGYGAVRSHEEDEGYICNRFPEDGADRSAEIQNAVWPVALNSSRFNCPAVGGALLAPGVGDGFTEPGFVVGYSSPRIGPRRRDFFAEYDDIVAWMPMEELVSELNERGALPAQLWPPIGLEQ